MTCVATWNCVTLLRLAWASATQANDAVILQYGRELHHSADALCVHVCAVVFIYITCVLSHSFIKMYWNSATWQSLVRSKHLFISSVVHI